MKKFLLVSVLVLCMIASAFCLIACNTDENEETPFVAPSFDFTKPEGLPDYALTIEWIGKDGNSTSFVPNRPTAIIFNDATEYNRKEGINLDTEAYNANVIDSKISLKKVSHLWYRQGWNIGVFHYENFADDSRANVTNKIYNSSSMTYVNVDGEVVTKAPDFNLTEAFISQLLKSTTSDALALGSGKYIQELRFIGNGVGASLAVSAGEYLDYLYENGAVGVGYLPDRIDLIDPYFSNTGVATVVDFYSQTTLASALTYNSKAIVELADKGTVFTLVESDSKFYDSYDNRYSGVSVIDDKVTFTEDGDSKLYLDIKKNVAYLNFRETFSSKLPESYKDLRRSTLDWFLYTINGSDLGDNSSEYERVDTISDTDIRPMIDGFNMTGTGTSSSVKYSVSAWTPTVYLRAVRGREYNMERYSSGKKTTYTMERFRAENFQISDITIDDYYAVCGYVYEDVDKSYFVNLNRSGIANATIFMTITVQDEKTDVSKTKEISIKSDKDGFFFYNLGPDNLGASIVMKVTPPQHYYRYTSTDANATSNYLYHSKNTITTAGGLSTTLSSTKNQNFFLYFANCGLTK